MKMMPFWIVALPLTLFWVGSTTPSDAQTAPSDFHFEPPKPSTLPATNAIQAKPAAPTTPSAAPTAPAVAAPAAPAPTPAAPVKAKQQAFILPKSVGVLNEPKPNALSILQLKQGDPVEVIAQQDGYTKIRYKLEGDFPIEGFVPSGAISTIAATGSALTGEHQAYQAEGVREPQMEVKEMPKGAMPEIVQPQLKSKAFGGGKVESAPVLISESKPHVREGGPWVFEGHMTLGFNTLEESFTTKKTDTQVYADAPFLSYEMTGFMIGARGRVGYQWGELEAGGYGSYDLTFFQGSVPSASTTFNPGIIKTNVQALDHHLMIGPYVRYPFRFHKDWSVTPELRILPELDLITTNQLKSTDNISPGVPGQAVLYSTTSISILAEVAPQVGMPYGLTLTPRVAVTLFNTLTEGQTIESVNGVALAEDKTLRTGAPDSPGMLFHYGATLGWNAKRLGWETVNLFASYQITDVSKKFTGKGNRAGVAMLDTKSEAKKTSIALGMEYLF